MRASRSFRSARRKGMDNTKSVFFTEDKVEKQPENEVERTVNIPPRVCEK